MMKRIGLLVLMVTLASTAAFAAQARWQGSGGWGAQGAYGRMYNPSSVETVTGEVVAVKRMTPMRGMGQGIHVELKTDQETVAVHLGPAWYIERLDAGIAKGDRLEVRGSRVTVGGKPAIIAAEVKKGEDVLKLRDENGVPAWSGWRRAR